MCSICGVEFPKKEHCDHIKTQFHELNVQRAERAMAPLTYAEYYEQTKAPEAVKSRTEMSLSAPRNSKSCCFCQEIIRDPLAMLDHLKGRHFFQIRYAEHIMDPQGLLDRICLFFNVYFKCMQCEQAFGSRQQLINHIRTTSHSYEVNELVEEFYDFRDSWPEEFRASETARRRPFVLFDRDSIERFRRLGIIGDFRRKQPYVQKSELIANGMMLSGKTSTKPKRHHVKLLPTAIVDRAAFLRGKALSRALEAVLGIVVCLCAVFALRGVFGYAQLYVTR